MFHSPARLPAVRRRKNHASFDPSPASPHFVWGGGLRADRNPTGRTGFGAGPAPEHARRVRLLRIVAVMVALVLRAIRGARQWRALATEPMRRPAVLVRGSRVVAAIRARLSGILPTALAPSRPQ